MCLGVKGRSDVCKLRSLAEVVMAALNQDRYRLGENRADAFIVYIV